MDRQNLSWRYNSPYSDEEVIRHNIVACVRHSIKTGLNISQNTSCSLPLVKISIDYGRNKLNKLILRLSFLAPYRISVHVLAQSALTQTVSEWSKTGLESSVWHVISNGAFALHGLHVLYQNVPTMSISYLRNIVWEKFSSKHKIFAT